MDLRQQEKLQQLLAQRLQLGKLCKLLDEWNSVNARLKQASSSADDFAASQRQLMEISQKNRYCVFR